MKAMIFFVAAFIVYSTAAVTINDITGTRYLSPLSGKDVANVTGVVTAKASNGIYIRSTKPDRSNKSSNSLFVFSSSIGGNLTVGDSITLDGRVSEFRSAAADIYITELTSPRNVRLISRNNTIQPVLVGKNGREPPTKQFSGLDGGDVFGLPNNRSQISVKNPELQPAQYGMDFWESLSSELVIIKNVTAIARPNNFRDTWIRGDWKVSGLNSRGGLTMTDKDGNPETVIIGTPLDGTRNPTTTKIGDELEDIVGIATWAFSFYRILPLTAIKFKSSRQPLLPPPTTLVSTKACSGLTLGDYNVANLAPTSSHLPKIAAHIVDFLKTPDLLFLQEIQDNNGPTNDAVVDANLTLSRLVSEIFTRSGVNYSYTNINPVDDKDGGQPGGNIRPAYLYNPTVIRLHKPNPGSSTNGTTIINSPAGPELSLNPGLIDPTNTAWIDSRKPLVAAWETLDGKNTFFTVNVHFASKGGSSSIEGDARPPVNGVVDVRTQQATVTGQFIAKLLARDPGAKVVAAGDFNDFTFTKPMETFVQRSGLRDLDAVFRVPKVERYTYLFDMNCQQLDHMFVSRGVRTGAGGYEHLHVNTWADAAGMVSDHDPSVARLDVCEKRSGGAAVSSEQDLEPAAVSDDEVVPEV